MELTLKELKPLLKYIINNNDVLEEHGKLRTAINICGEAGYGKSQIVEEVANEMGANFVKLSLAMVSETGDLSGYPVCLHYACKDDGSDYQWVVPELIDSFIRSGYKLTGETKMSYALPEWYHKINPEKPTILLLDDLSRSLPNIIQAVYELVYKQEFWSFKLPPRTTVILTTNPSNGDYNVNDEDEAAITRRVNFTVKWDVDSWAEWAERNELDNRCINFLLQYHYELMENMEDRKHIVNARSYTMFANIISGIPNWENPNNLGMILQIASGCFDDENNIIGNLFTTFIANKLDKLISPEELLLGDWKKVYPKIKEAVYNGENYRADIAAILHTRLLNYTDYYFSKKEAKTKVVIDRLMDIIHAEKPLFEEDLIYNIIKNLFTKYPARMKDMVFNPEIRARILG